MTAEPLVSAAADPDISRRAARGRTALLTLLIVASVAATFGRGLRYGFVDWDDPDNFTENPYFNPVTASTVPAFWRTIFSPQSGRNHLYLPVTYTAWAGVGKLTQPPVPDDQGVFVRPFGFHLVNLVGQAINALLVWRILVLLFGEGWPALAATLLWALHPMRVEPVVWATGFKDILSGSFAFTAILLYLDFARRRATHQPGGGWRYMWATACFAISLLCKPTMMAAAPVAWVLGVWRFPAAWDESIPDTSPRGKRWLTIAGWRRSIVPLLPWFVAAMPVLWINKHGQDLGAASPWYPAWVHVPIALDTLAFYLQRTAWPRWLGIIYGRTPQYVVHSHQIGWTWLLPAAVFALAWLLRRRAPYVLLGVITCTLAVLPASGLIWFEHQNFSDTADRYFYLPAVGLAVALAGLLVRFQRSRALRIAVPVLVVLLAARSIWQCGVWRDTITLFRHCELTGDNTYVAYGNVGYPLLIAHDYQGAIEQLTQACRINPNYAKAITCLGGAYAGLGDDATAMRYYCQAVQADPTQFEAEADIGNALNRLGKNEEALPHYVRAVQLNPGNVSVRFFYGKVLFQLGRPAEALAQFNEAVKINPRYVKALFARANLIGQQGDIAAAVDDMRHVVNYQPHWAEPLNALAYTLAANPHAPPHDPAEPIDYAARAVELTGRQSAVCLDTLSIANQAAGRMADAIAVGEEARAVAAAAGQTHLVDAINHRLASLPSAH